MGELSEPWVSIKSGFLTVLIIMKYVYDFCENSLVFSLKWVAYRQVQCPVWI